MLGGAGTGKTTLIEAIVRQSRKAYGCGLCAPTGKAARNLSERSNMSTATVYRMLRMTPDDHMLNAQLEDDLALVIVDEASMLTLKEFAGILEGAGTGAKIVLIGDPHQLQAVGSGNIMQDLLALGLPRKHLSTFHRQGGVECALLHNVRSFDTCHTLEDLRFDETFMLKDMQPGEMMLKFLATQAAHRYSRGKSIQVVAPTNLMVYDLNCRIQELLNPVTLDAAGNPLELEVQDKHKRLVKLRHGDRVMMLRNNYSLDYCNGDTGTLYINSSSEDELDYYVVFPDGRRSSFATKQGLRDMTLAYAITVHKSHGSEYDTILMPITKSRMLSRNLVYTAFSRAKKQVLMVGEREALEAGLRTYTEPRRSGLVERVKQALWEHEGKCHVA